MKLELENGKRIDTSKPIDISLPLSTGDNNTNAWYCESPVIEPVRTEAFLGSVKEGGTVNFRNITFNPHGNGTHTECLGHISKEVYSINDRLQTFFFTARLITVAPKHKKAFPENDLVIDQEMLEEAFEGPDVEAIVIRTLPNNNKQGKDYSNTNPPYLTEDAMKWVIEKNFTHFLIDLPSVDREFDDGKLAAHHSFWNYPDRTDSIKTITELIMVPDKVHDGNYILNLMIAPFENDASPSKPVLYEISSI